MKSSEISQMTDKELVDRIDTAAEDLQRMKLNHTVSPLENPLKIKEARKDIARLRTELSVRKNSSSKTE